MDRPGQPRCDRVRGRDLPGPDRRIRCSRGPTTFHFLTPPAEAIAAESTCWAIPISIGGRISPRLQSGGRIIQTIGYIWPILDRPTRHITASITTTSPVDTATARRRSSTWTSRAFSRSAPPNSRESTRRLRWRGISPPAGAHAAGNSRRQHLPLRMDPRRRHRGRKAAFHAVIELAFLPPFRRIYQLAAAIAACVFSAGGITSDAPSGEVAERLKATVC